MENTHDKINAELLRLKNELAEMGITTDRDLVKILGIKDEDKKMLYTWITYQCAFSKRSGYTQGREELKQELYDLITPKVSTREHKPYDLSNQKRLRKQK